MLNITTLVEDDTGAIIQSIAHQCMNDPEQINMDVLRQWLTGKGKHPITWKTLAELLHDIELNTLAREIEIVKCPVRKSKDLTCCLHIQVEKFECCLHTDRIIVVVCVKLLQLLVLKPIIPLSAHPFFYSKLDRTKFCAIQHCSWNL